MQVKVKVQAGMALGSAICEYGVMTLWDAVQAASEGSDCGPAASPA